MTHLLQNIIVMAGVTACCAYIAWQGYRTLTLRGKGKLGACCAKGCDAGTAPGAKPQAAQQFIPSDMLARPRSRR
jgi:hypothetical protein